MLRSGIFLSCITLVVSAISFVNQLVLASYFGASLQMSAYLVAYSLPSVITGVLGMLFSFSAVPVLVKEKQAEEGYSAVLGSFFVAISLAAFAVAAIGWCASGPLLRHVAGALPLSVAGDTLVMSRIFWGNAALSMFVSFLAAAHNVERRFVLPLLASGLPYIGMIVATGTLGLRWGAKATALGMLCGTAGSVVWLFVPICAAFDWSGVRRKRAEAIAFAYEAPFVLLAMSCFCAGSATEAFWAIRLVPSDLAYLGYSQRLVVALASLVAFGPSAVLMTRLSELNARGEFVELRSTAAKALRMSVFVTTPMALVMAVFAQPVVRLLFQRGAFDSRTTAGVSEILPLVMCGSVGLCASIMMMKALFSCKLVRQGAVIGVLQVTIYFIISGLLSSVLGLQGIVIAFATSWWVTLVGLLYVLWRTRVRELWNSLEAFCRSFAGVIVLEGIAAWSAKALLLRAEDQCGIGGLVLRLMVSCAVSMIVFGAAAVFCRLPEMQLLRNALYSRMQFGTRRRLSEGSNV